MRVYTASKLKHYHMWRKLHHEWKEIHFTARWPFIAGSGIPDTAEYALKFWQDNLADIRASQYVLVYAASPEEKLRGALIEAGAGIALGKGVIVVGEHPDFGTWQYHPHVTRAVDLETARGMIKSGVIRCP